MMPSANQGSVAIGCEQFADTVRRDGFGIVRGALDVRAAARMREMLDRLLPEARHPSSDLLEVHLPHIVEKHPDFVDLAIAPPLIRVLTELFGTVPHLVGSYGHIKPARTTAHTSVHSDVAHLRGVPHYASTLMVKIMYALTPTGSGSGATLVYPGTHRAMAGGQLLLEGREGVHLQLDPGDLQVFHANIQHTATPNVSDSPRLSLWFVYAQPWMRVFPGHEYSETFLGMLHQRIVSNPVLAGVFGLSNPYSTLQK
jgi:hypothetical protein